MLNLTFHNTDVQLPSGNYRHSLPVGFPSPALDHLKDPLDIGKVLAPKPLSTFFVHCEGDSMKGIIPGKALLVVDTSVKPRNHNIVIVFINGNWTVRFILFRNQQCYLVPANPDYETTTVTEEMEMTVWAVVTKIIIDPKNFEHVCPDRL